MSDLLTIDEAAKRLRRRSTRALRDWLHDHQPADGEPSYYLQAGRDRLFSERHLARIEARMAADEIEKAIPKTYLHTQGCVYFVRVGTFIKIGWALEVRKRIQQLQVGSPYLIEVLAIMIGTMRDEKELHKRFAEDRESGEWFKDSLELRRRIKALRNHPLTEGLR